LCKKALKGFLVHKEIIIIFSWGIEEGDKKI